MTTTFNPELMEGRFQTWYADLAKSLGLPPDPDAPGQSYNYRAAYLYGLNTDTPIPGANLQFPATFQTNMPPVSPGQMVGLPEIIAQGQGQQQQTNPGAQPWKMDFGPPPVQVAEPPRPQFSERFKQVGTPPVAAPVSQPLTFGGKPAIGQGGRGRWVDPSEIQLDQPGGGQFINVEIPDKGMTVQFPADMPHDQITKVIQEQVYGQKKPGMNPDEILKDPAFHGLPAEEQRKALIELIPGFGNLPLDEQNRGLTEVAGLNPGQAGQQKPLDIKGFRQLYPQYNDLSDQELSDRLYQKYYSDMDRAVFDKKLLGAGAQPEIGDPMAASLNMFQPVEAVKELGKQVAEHGPALGTMATAAATKIPGVVAAPITGMAVAAGGLMNRAYTGKETPITPEEQTLMEAGLPFATGDMLKDFMLGVGADVAGRGIVKGIEKTFAPALGKIPGYAQTTIDWAKEKNLPFSLDVVESWPAAMAQHLSDWGLGRYITNYQRGKLIQATTQEAQNIMGKLGLPETVPTDTALSLVNYLRVLKKGKANYAEVETALDAIPKDYPVQAPNILKFLDDLASGQGPHVGLDTAQKAYRSSQVRGALQNIADNAGQSTMGELRDLGYWIHKGMVRSRNEGTLAFNKEVALNLKNAFLEDTKALTAPGYNESVGVLRGAADKAYSETQRWLENSPLLPSLLRKNIDPNNAEKFTNALFSDPYRITTKELKDRLINSGQEDLWNSLVAGKIQTMFSQATKGVNPHTGEFVFQPGKFIQIYKKNQNAIKEFMPDQAAALGQWFDISRGVLKDFKRAGGGEVMGLSLAAGMAGGGLYAGSFALTVGAGFSPVAALATMGPKVAFLRPWLTKGTLGPGEEFLAQGLGQAGKMGLLDVYPKNTPNPTGGR